MDYIKEAFSKVKYDIDSLKNELNNLKDELSEVRELLIKICENFQKKEEKDVPAYLQINQANNENIPTHPSSFKPFNTGNLRISIGNRGVPADRQTNQQTDRQGENSIENAPEMIKSLDNLQKEIHKKFNKLTVTE